MSTSRLWYRMAIDRQLKRGGNSAETVPYILLAILAIAFLIRLVVALRTGIQIEESRMAFAVYTVAHSGFPKLDSDVLYLLGTPVNYLFSPLAWVFQGSDLVTAIRVGNAMLSTIAVFVVWVLVWDVNGRIVMTAAVTLCAALDPMGLYWGTIASPYASLALIALLVVYSGYRAFSEPDESILRRTDVSNPVVWLSFWLIVGSFTHYAIWLFVPGIAIVSFMRWGKGIFQSRHPMRIALEVSIIAPILVWLFGNLVGPGAASNFNPGPPSFNQIWNNLDRLRNVEFNLSLWRTLYYGSRYSQLVAFLIALTTGMIIAWFFLRKRISDGNPLALTTLVLILGSYWGPVLIIADGSLSPLLLGILPFGYLLVAFALRLMVAKWDIQLSRWRIWMAPSAIAAALLMLPILAYLLQGARWQIDYQTPDPDYFEASEYIETVKQPGQAIITPFPAVAWLVMDDLNRNDIVALGGPKDGTRLWSETRDFSEGDNRDYYVDYWTGRQSIGTTAQLCQYLLFTDPLPLIVTDTTRLEAEWAFKGEFATAITLGTQVLSQGNNGLEIRSPLPLDQWPTEALDTCGVQPGQPS